MHLKDTDRMNNLHSLSLPENRMKYYMERTGAKLLEDITFEQRNKIFLLAIKDCMDGAFSIDALSSLGDKIWQIPSEMNDPAEEELNRVVHACSELSFYIRKIDDPDHSTFNTFMYEVIRYFNQSEDRIALCTI